MVDEIKDTTKEVVADPKAAEELEAAKEIADDKMTEVLDKLGLDSVEDLMANYETSQELLDKVGDVDIEKAIEAQAEYEKVQAFWAEQAIAEKEKEELPEETIKRLKQENTDQANHFKNLHNQRVADADDAKAAKSYFGEVNTILGKEDLSKHEKDFVGKFLGVDNKFNEIDIDSKSEVRNMVKDGLKQYDTFKKQIIEDYRAGKIDMPDITKSDQTSVTTESKKITDLKSAGQVFMEMMTKK